MAQVKGKVKSYKEMTDEQLLRVIENISSDADADGSEKFNAEFELINRQKYRVMKPKKIEIYIAFVTSLVLVVLATQLYFQVTQSPLLGGGNLKNLNIKNVKLLLAQQPYSSEKKLSSTNDVK